MVWEIIIPSLGINVIPDLTEDWWKLMRGVGIRIQQTTVACTTWMLCKQPNVAELEHRLMSSIEDFEAEQKPVSFCQEFCFSDSRGLGVA